ncbi:hypothetical protein KM043_011223 [Ampulex compressa]|nr:hypothetical protein KM043_011223 [Ampulex compressa]
MGARVRHAGDNGGSRIIPSFENIHLLPAAPAWGGGQGAQEAACRPPRVADCAFITLTRQKGGRKEEEKGGLLSLRAAPPGHEMATSLSNRRGLLPFDGRGYRFEPPTPVRLGNTSDSFLRPRYFVDGW